MSVVALLALVVRVILMAHSHGGSDLRNYTYFSRIVLGGHDPFLSPAHGLFAPSFADSPPLEYAAFSLLLRISNSPTTLRAAFALADVGVILVVGFLARQPRSWRAAFIAFYAFNPLVLISWTVYAEDKTLLFLAITIAIMSIQRGWIATSWLATTFLTAFKFLGAFLAPVLLVETVRQRRTRAAWLIGGFVIVAAASNLPWFPHSLDAFAHRDLHLNVDPPIHSSPTLLLSRIGLYATFEPRLLTAIAIAAVVVLFLLGRLEAPEALALSLFSGYIFLPDDSFGRLLLIALPFLLLTRPTRSQWGVLWVTTTLAAIAAAIETQGVPHAVASIGGALRATFSHEATVASVLWINAPVVAIMVIYVLQRERDHRSSDSTRPAASTTSVLQTTIPEISRRSRS